METAGNRPFFHAFWSILCGALFVVTLFGCNSSERAQSTQNSGNSRSEQEGTGLSQENGQSGGARRNQDGGRPSFRAENAANSGADSVAGPEGETARESQPIQLDMNQNGSEKRRRPEAAGELGPAGFLLPQGTVTTVAPRDFVLGGLALADRQQGDAAERRSGTGVPVGPEAELQRLVREFFLADSFDPQLVLSDERQRLERLLKGRWESAEEVRIAPPDQLVDGRWHMQVRLLSAVGEAVGEVYVEEAGPNWYISDVAIDMSALNKPRPERRFEPGQAPVSGGF